MLLKISPLRSVFAKFSGSVVLWPQMINLKLVSRSLIPWQRIFCWLYPQNLIHADGASCVISFNNRFAGCRQLVAQPGGLNTGLCPTASYKHQRCAEGRLPADADPQEILRSTYWSGRQPVQFSLEILCSHVLIAKDLNERAYLPE